MAEGDPTSTPPAGAPKGGGVIGLPSGYTPRAPYNFQPSGPPIKTPQDLAQQSTSPTGQYNVFGQPFTWAGQQDFTDPVSGDRITAAKYGETIYHEGDQFAPAQHPDYIPVLQSRLIQAGLLNPKDVRIGVWDDKSANAYKTLLAFANSSGGTDHDALDYLIKNPQLGKTAAGAVRTPVTIQSTENLKASFAGTAEQLTGGDLPSSEADAFVQQYREGEMRAAAAQWDTQTARANAAATAAAGGQPATGGAVVEGPMNPEAYIRSHDQAQMQAYNMLQRGLEFYRLLGVSV